MAFVFVNGADMTPDVLTEENQIKQVLHWCGFRSQAHKNALYGDSIQLYSDIKNMSERDITLIAKDYSSRSGISRINFGLRRIKKLKAVIHWVKDHRRISSTASVEGMSGDQFTTLLDNAIQRAQIREQFQDDSVTKAKESSPGPLKSEAKWLEWETKFINYLSTIPGVDGVPLSYVIREEENVPGPAATFTSFVEQTIASAPLQGTYYEADRATVHQAIVSYTAGQPSEDWIKTVSRYKNGRRSMKALRDHFAGEGNVTRRIAEAERLRDSLHYKNERSLSFESFLTKSQKMFNIFEKHGEGMEEDAKIRFLFKNVQHSGLQSDIAALKASITTSAVGTISYTTVCNHLSAVVSQLPEFISKGRNVSGVVTDSGSQSIYKTDGSINANEWIPNWNDLSFEDKKKVIAERKKLGIRLGAGGKGDNKSGGVAKGNPLFKAKKQNSKFKRKIKALKKSLRESEVKPEDAEEESEDNDAGDQFGGKSSKKRQKSKK